MFTNKQKIVGEENYFATKFNQKTIFLIEYKFPSVSPTNNASIFHLEKIFCEEGTVKNLPHQWCRQLLTPIKMYKIRMQFSQLFRKGSVQVKTSSLSTDRATKLLKLYPYRVSEVQKLKPSDCPKRVKFHEWILINYPGNKAGSTISSSVTKYHSPWLICELTELSSMVNRKFEHLHW